jgi:hypothetical protein
MSGDSAARVHYFDKQFLRVDEFRDEQLYQLSLRRRHNNTQHTWGIASGLEIAKDEQSGAIIVRPGLAIDGYGRELLLQTKLTVVPESFDDLATDRLDLWLVYERQEDGNVPEGYGECSAPGKSYRATEHPQLLVERPLSARVDARRPPGVPREALDAPVPPLSDDRADEWRVYLGRIIRQPDGSISIDGAQRPYVGVVAESIDHPANAARVEIGRDSSSAEHTRQAGGTAVSYKKTDEKPLRRFAVFVPEDLGTQQQDPAPVELAPRIEVFDDGGIGLNGQTVVRGNLNVAGGAVQFTEPATFTADDAPELPSMYRYAESGFDELRIDLGTVDVVKRRFVIGFTTPDGAFSPALSVALDENGEPSVTIFGNLKIEGTIVDKVLPVMIGPEAIAAARAAFQQGLTQGNTPP